MKDREAGTSAVPKLETSLADHHPAGRTTDHAFREAGLWDGDDAEQLAATLRAARDAGGSKPPVAL